MKTPIIDLHTDTIYALRRSYSTGNLRSNSGHVDLNRMDSCPSVTVCFALFVDEEETPRRWATVNELHDAFTKYTQEHEQTITHIHYPTEMVSHQAILTVEEGGVLEGDINRVATLASWGVRIMTLLWNWENEIGFPHHRRGRLKEFGYHVVEAMEEQRILVDVSHLNDEGIDDVLSRATRPIIASHSNARAICNHTRNLSDEHIRSIADSGGVIGLTFCPPFVSERSNHTSIEALVAHLAHLFRIGGKEVLALGSDFDGITGSLEVAGYEEMEKLHEALIRSGFSSAILDGFWYKNAQRVLGGID
ncbi:MAG: membrane dipeptidase [Sphaerochaeta sp.]